MQKLHPRRHLTSSPKLWVEENCPHNSPKHDGTLNESRWVKTERLKILEMADFIFVARGVLLYFKTPSFC